MGIRTSIAAILLLIPAMAAGKGGIVDDFIPVCDSMSVLVSEKTGVQGELKLKNVMKRSGRLDFYFDESLSDFPWREDSYSWFRAELKSLFPEEYSRYRLGEIYCKRDKASRLPVKPPGYDGNPVQTPYRRQDPKGRINPLCQEDIWPSGRAMEDISARLSEDGYGRDRSFSPLWKT